jgi:hypothetical protein
LIDFEARNRERQSLLIEHAEQAEALLAEAVFHRHQVLNDLGQLKEIRSSREI